MANRKPIENTFVLILTPIVLSIFLCGFSVYDATLYKNKPDLTKYGVQKLTVFYTQHVWRDADDRDAPPSFEGIIRRLKKANAKPGEMIVLDFEHWPLQGYRYKPWIYQTSLLNYIETIKRFKYHRPDVQFGFFGVVPVNNYKRSIQPVDSKAYQIWRGDVQRLNPLTNHIDVAFPVAYTYDDSPELWTRYLHAGLKEARSIYKGKVYPFIWPQYFDHAPTPPNLRLKYLNSTFWRHQLEAVYNNADGVVIWGGWDFANRQAAIWDDKAEWWLATKQFLRDHAIKLPP